MRENLPRQTCYIGRKMICRQVNNVQYRTHSRPSGKVWYGGTLYTVHQVTDDWYTADTITAAALKPDGQLNR